MNGAKQSGVDQSAKLAAKLGNLISVKGEDILLTTPGTQMVKSHRLRATVPAQCWKWKVVCGSKWANQKEHINGLELRAILTSLRWRFNTRLFHLTDSSVCLHALTRGRTSSRRLRRPMPRINENPADRPSRWGQRVRSKFRHAKVQSVKSLKVRRRRIGHSVDNHWVVCTA